MARNIPIGDIYPNDGSEWQRLCSSPPVPELFHGSLIHAFDGRDFIALKFFEKFYDACQGTSYEGINEEFDADEAAQEAFKIADAFRKASKPPK